MKNLNSWNHTTVSFFEARYVCVSLCAIILFTLSTCTKNSREYSRGVGVYPGDPDEDFSPQLFYDSKTYRNLALHRPAYHSSSYDYNLTAQLVTDGITDTRFPNWFTASTSQHGTLKKNEREWIIDHNAMSTLDIEGNGGWIQVEIGSEKNIPEIDRIHITGMVRIDFNKPEGWKFKLQGFSTYTSLPA